MLVASLRGATMADIVTDGPGQDATPVGPFTRIRKARFFVHQDRSVEIDLHAVHESDDGPDLMIEVKDWESEPSVNVARHFVAVKNALENQLERNTVFLFYSESGLGEDAVAALAEAGVLVIDPAKLAGDEASFERDG